MENLCYIKYRTTKEVFHKFGFFFFFTECGNKVLNERAIDQ